MNHADAAYALINFCRTFTGWSAGLSFFSELRRWTDLWLTGLRRLAGLRRLRLGLSYFQRRIRLLGWAWTGLGGLCLQGDLERACYREC
jgi:hypothetical protein